MQNVIDTFHEKDLIHVDRGAKLIDLTKFNKKLGKCLVQKSDGTSLYLTRDCGEAIKRYNTYKFDKMIYVIATQQDLHVAQFFEILKQMGYEWVKNLEHVNFGMVLGMSTRNGTVVFLDDILEETKTKMHEVMKKNETKYAQIEDPDKIADLVGISAVMIQDMQAKRINNYEFSWDRMLSFEGDTGPYLQYAHSRLSSVQRKSNIDESELTSANFELLTEECAQNLIRVLAQYPDTIVRALKTKEPSTIVTYLFNLTHIVSQSYQVLWVSGQEKDLATARLALYASARQVLHNGMTLLGLTPVDRM
jgi:arginyl-tRNA synthetase